jgi:2-keto-4-pentenoate hydratase/2-oxohepta-3-ene-1,7-dioic acid hydratase in catechol pathway
VKIANVKGRLAIVVAEGKAVDVETASAGKFSSSIQDIYNEWESFVAWSKTVDASLAADFAETDLDSPAPRPRQIFAIGMNYAKHAAEGGFSVPEEPTIFTKFQSCITGPFAEVPIPVDGKNDWETELVVVIGKKARRVKAANAFDYVAGYTMGQDISERVTQGKGPAPQFSFAKSFENFGPTGPVVVTIDEFADPNAIELGCSVDGDVRQNDNSNDLVFSVPQLIEYLSARLTLFPGDQIWTGTPSGVGLGRKPQVYLNVGEELVTWGKGIGEMRNKIVAAK